MTNKITDRVPVSPEEPQESPTRRILGDLIDEGQQVAREYSVLLGSKMYLLSGAVGIFSIPKLYSGI
ncbi:MAG TPA: hypothetical protein VN457_08475, partial [Chlamydiales bacterium]|nr:hypothetical protein [Chlamydiales bacterium]